MLVIDRRVEHLFEYCVEKHQLLDRRIANVLVLDSHRTSETSLSAMYICEPSGYNINCIAADFIRQPNRYRDAYVYFLPGGPDSAITNLRNRLGGRLSGFGIAPIGFLALERHVFSLGDPFANDRLYNRNVQNQHAYLHRTATQIVNVCQAIGEVPYIRYVNSSSDYAAHDLPAELAQSVSHQLEEIRDQIVDPEADRRGRAVLLILDRSVDAVAPLLHEFTYQAMAYDLLDIEANDTYKSADGEVNGKLTEEDIDWVDLRHLHISQVTEELTKRVQELKDANPHFADTTQDVTVHDIRNMMAALPSFVKTKSQMAVNLQIALDCVEKVDANMLKELAEVEQSSVLGEERDREVKTRVSDRFVSLLANDKVSHLDKVRLVLIYLLGRQTGLYAKDLERIRLHSKLGEWDIETASNICNFGYKAIKEDEDRPSRLGTSSITNNAFTQTISSTTKHLIPSRNKGTMPTFYGENESGQFLFARFTPGVKNLIESMIHNKLDPNMFPYVNGDDVPDYENNVLETATSLRNPRQRATWERSKSVGQASRQRIIIFMLGGFTASESRTVYELSTKYSKDIIIGGSDRLTPKKFVIALGRQNLELQDLRLPVMFPDGAAPRHLLESDRETNQHNQAAQQAAAAPQQAPVSTNGDSQPVTNLQAGAQELTTTPSKRRGFFSLKKKKVD